MSEQITLLELADIIGLEFECPQCQLKILFTITPTCHDRMPAACPSCGIEWVYEKANYRTKQVVDIINSLQNLAKREDIKTKVRLRIKE